MATHIDLLFTLLFIRKLVYIISNTPLNFVTLKKAPGPLTPAGLGCKPASSDLCSLLPAHYSLNSLHHQSSHQHHARSIHPSLPRYHHNISTHSRAGQSTRSTLLRPISRLHPFARRSLPAASRLPPILAPDPDRQPRQHALRLFIHLAVIDRVPYRVALGR
jgi:hypothetical protein